jgi:hypothetical protein
MKTNPISNVLKICVLLSCALPGLQSWSATFSLNPSADAFVTTGPTGNLVNSNYGAAGALSIAAPGSSKGEFQSVMQFNFSIVKSSFDSQFGPGQWSIQSVTLTLSNAPPNNGIFNSSAAGHFTTTWMQNNSWVEGTGTPAAPSPTGINFSTISNFVSAGDETLGTFSYNGATSGSASYSLNLTPGFSADVLSGDLVSFRFFGADSSVSYLFDSENFQQVSGRPILTIVAVPEPAALGLSALALVVFGCKRQTCRRRQR